MMTDSMPKSSPPLIIGIIGTGVSAPITGTGDVLGDGIIMEAGTAAGMTRGITAMVMVGAGVMIPGTMVTVGVMAATTATMAGDITIIPTAEVSPSRTRVATIVTQVLPLHAQALALPAEGTWL